MKKFLLAIAGVALSLSASAAVNHGASTVVRPGQEGLDLTQGTFRFLPKAKAQLKKEGFGSIADLGKSRKGASKAESFELNVLPAADDLGYLDGPNNETWYYTVNYSSTTVDHGAYQEEVISGYTITVFNAAFAEVGKIEDSIELVGNETRVAQVQIGSLVTQKFFNYDNSYELMICIACNTSDYVNTYRTKVYSIGNNTAVAEFPGYYVSAVNTATDAWSEKFWITFITEAETQTPEINGVINMMDNVFTTYKSAGYSGQGDPVLVTRIPAILLPGEHSVPFLSTAYEGKPYFATANMKYCWYEDPYDYNNENPTPGNELQVAIYTTASSWSSDVELYSTTTVPSNTTSDNIYFLYAGAFSYNDDLSFGRYTTDGTPSVIVTTEYYQSAHDSYYYDYDVYSTAPQGETAAGVKKVNLGKGVSGGYFMNDIAGFDPQVMYVNSTASGDVEFTFVSLISGLTEVTLPYYLGNNLFVTASTDRIPSNDGYMFVVPQTQGASQENGDIYTAVAYVTTDGAIDHVDYLNLGKDVDLAQVYSAPDAFNPYIFNLDSNIEYMVLVKRRNSPTDAGNHEELMIVSSDTSAAPLLQLTPDDELGALVNIALLNVGTDNARMVVIYDKDYKYTTVEYKLPLNLYENGDGSIENPYVITTVGGLEMIKEHPNAHYVLGNDIDCAGYTIDRANNFSFGGTLDGQGHVVKNLSVTGYGLIPTLVGGSEPSEDYIATVRNINFVNPVFNTTKDAQGLVVGYMTCGTLDNVHVYGGQVTSEGDVAGLVGKAALYSSIQQCSFQGSISSPENSAAGIVSNVMTSSTVKACAFKGSINGGMTVGGIVGTLNNNAGELLDCHVNADITGQNTVGGIAGESNRTLIANCHVEGTLTATEAPRWGGGPKVGGIAGSLAPDYSSMSGGEGEEGTEPTEPAAVIKNCYVNLTSMTYTGEPSEEYYAGQNDTMHRIVGFTGANAEPEVIDYDEDWNPVYGEPMGPDAGLVNNYAVETLAKVSEGVEAAGNTTEGQSIAADEVNFGFLMEQGWLYGYDVENPWSFTGDSSKPSLFFEGGIVMVTPSEAEIAVGETVVVELTLVGETLTEDMLEGFIMEVVDESVLEIGDMGMTENAITVAFKGLKAGSSKVTLGINGKSAEAMITVKENSGIEDVVAPEGDALKITFDGRTATAPAAVLNVYSISGALLITANETADLSNLAAGVYVITAQSATAKSTLKVSLR